MAANYACRGAKRRARKENSSPLTQKALTNDLLTGNA